MLLSIQSGPSHCVDVMNQDLSEIRESSPAEEEDAAADLTSKSDSESSRLIYNYC